MLPTPNRRTFLGASLATAAASTVNRTYAAANDKIVIGVMGMGGRGTHLAKSFAKLENTEIAYVCDVDAERAEQAKKALSDSGKSAPKVVGDFRRILDDKSVDLFICAPCNHWHAPATILACLAGKHVYVEKPCSHNAREGELMVQAARKMDRKVQMGSQRRSFPKLIEAIQALKEGIIGRVYYSQSWYANSRPSIDTGVAGDPPAGLDYELWQGPAVRKPFKSNYLHYNWHWFWNWGNGELGNNGIHMIDVSRWGLDASYCKYVSSAGGRYRYDDDQQTPDTHIVSFTFPDQKAITWEGYSCNRIPGITPDVLFQGEKGSLAIFGGGYTLYDDKGKEIKKEAGPSSDLPHMNNLLQAIREGAKLNAEIEEGHKSTLLCHLGNIAHRTSRALHTDSSNGHIVNDPDAMKLWSREYAPGWEPKV
jgi:predicted dehydrogenase